MKFFGFPGKFLAGDSVTGTGFQDESFLVSSYICTDGSILLWWIA
jgi:hypothetical protein